MKKFISHLFLLFIFSILFYSCKNNPSSPEKAPPPPPPTVVGNATLKNNAVVLKTYSYILKSISPNKISFSTAPSKKLKPGMVIVSGPSDIAKEGFLRKIIYVSSDGKNLTTVDAPLDALIKSGSVNLGSSFLFKNSSSEFLKKGIIRKIKNNEIYYSLNSILYDADGNLNTINDQIRLKGNLNLSGEIKDGYLKFGPVSALISMKFNEGVDLNLIAEKNFSLSKEEVLIKERLGTIVIPSAIPITITPYWEIFVKFKVLSNSKIKTGIKDNASFYPTLKYSGGWKFEKTFINNFTPKTPELTSSGNIKISIGARLSFNIFETLGPSFSVSPYFELSSDVSKNPWWKLYAGADGAMGISTGWLSPFVPGKDWNIFDYSKLIAKAKGGLNLPPTAVINISPSSGLTNMMNIQFSARSSTDDQTPQSKLVGRWDFDGDGNWDTQFVSINDIQNHTYAFSKDYNVKLEVKDEEGLIGTATKKISVSKRNSNSAPVFYSSSFSPPDNSTNVNPDITFSWDAYDPEGDPIDYTLYIGNSPSSLVKIANQTEKSYHLGNYFPSGTKIYWEVQASDNHNNSTKSGVLNFTVGSGGNSGKKGIIYFISTKGVSDGSEIYSINSDGTNEKRITYNNTHTFISQIFSNKIIYSKTMGSTNNRNIYISNLNGSNPYKISSQMEFNGEGQITPSGNRIVYIAGKLEKDLQIYISNLDGSNSINISKEPDYFHWDISLSPNGKSIAYVSNKTEGDYDIYKMDINGNNKTRLTNDGESRSPRWSPDNSKIVYGHVSVTSGEIWIMNSDGTNKKQLTNSLDGEPSFTSDGRIIFISGRTGRSQIFIMNQDGSNIKQITNQKDSWKKGLPLWKDK